MKIKQLLEKAKNIISKKLKLHSLKIEFTHDADAYKHKDFIEIAFNYYVNENTVSRYVLLDSIPYESTHDARVLLEQLKAKVYEISIATKPGNEDFSV